MSVNMNHLSDRVKEFDSALARIEGLLPVWVDDNPDVAQMVMLLRVATKEFNTVTESFRRAAEGATEKKRQLEVEKLELRESITKYEDKSKIIREHTSALEEMPRHVPKLLESIAGKMKQLLDQSVSSLKNTELAPIRNQLQALQSHDIDNIENKLSGTTSALDEIKSGLASLQKQSDTKNALNEIKTVLANVQNQLGAKGALNEIKRGVASLEKQSDTINALNEIKSVLANMQDQSSANDALDEIKSGIVSLQNQSNTINALNEIKRDVASLQTQPSTEKALDEIKSGVASLQDQSGFQGALDDIKGGIASMQIQSGKTDALDEIKRGMENIQEQLSGAQSAHVQISSLEKRLEEKDALIAQLEDRCRRQLERADKFAQDSAQLESRMADLQQSTSEQIDGFTARLTSHEAGIRALKRQFHEERSWRDYYEELAEARRAQAIIKLTVMHSELKRFYPTRELDMNLDPNPPVQRRESKLSEWELVLRDVSRRLAPLVRGELPQNVDKYKLSEVLWTILIRPHASERLERLQSESTPQRWECLRKMSNPSADTTGPESESVCDIGDCLQVARDVTSKGSYIFRLI
ncbi:hypothetical protein F4779DRAFT_616384 [Xylariaceae sp. FL0662B]|nr:hypothetical protein F4779DRAFT_616384 [Xylariaceae sp. FL0662B]